MEAFKELITNNAILALLCVALVYAIGDIIGVLSKAWVHSVFVVAVLFIIGYWTFFPTEIVTAAGFGAPFTSTVCIYLLITHMGTTISIKELLKQWKIIVICLAGLAGMVLLCMILAWTGIVDWNYVISGLPPLTGGIVAAVTMKDAATALGLTDVAALAIIMYCAQGFAGYPLTALCLKREGRNLLKAYRSGVVKKTAAGEVDSVDGKMKTEEGGKKLIPALPDKFFTTSVAILKLSIVALGAFYMGKIKFPGIGAISGAVWALILGIIFTELGFLDRSILNKCGCFNFICFALMLYVFDGLKQATPEMLLAVLGPLVIIIVVGVLGMGILSAIVGKVLKVSPYMAFATSLTALYGFPPNLILTTEASKALAENDDEYQYLMDTMLPQMIVGGFVTVTITSVIIAGLFVPLLRG